MSARMTDEKKPYPTWICRPCGRRHGKEPVALSTWHQNECGICGNLDAVTEPRDFGHLREGWDKRPTPLILKG